MKYISIQELTPGMESAEDVYNLYNQLLFDKGHILTEKSIGRLEFYSIPGIMIKEESAKEAIENPEASQIPEVVSYSQKIQHSTEFKQFKEHYTENIGQMQDSIGSFINGDAPLDTKNLIQNTLNILPDKSTSINTFDMLHNMRQFDDSTYTHCLSVSLICRVMGQWLNFSEKEQQVLLLAGLLHDIGKMILPAEIVKKPGKLTAEEYDIMKTHTKRGYELLEKQNIDIRVKYVALMHHERFDGSGYPTGLSGKYIDDYARIVAIADVYEAMTAARAYRAPLCPFSVISIFESEGLQKYDPHYILVFLQNIVSSYLHNNVLLSDNSVGEIVMINNLSLSRPIVKVGDKYVDLSKERNLSIVALV